MEFLDIIIVNDGSKDNTLEIAEGLQKEFPETIRVINKENGHYGSCVNYALDIAEGKYFRMLDPDDWCDNKALNDLLNKLKTSDADLVITIAEDRLNGKDLICRMDIPEHIQEGYIYDARTFSALKHRYKWMFCSHVLTYKTSILHDINLRLQTGICYTDNEYVFYPLDKIESIAFFRLPLYQYYVGREGASTTEQSIVKAQREMWTVLEKMFNYYYAHKSITCSSVQDNQKVLIVELTKWILNPLLTTYGYYGEESDNIVLSLHQQLKKDDSLLEMIRHNYRNVSIPLYIHYLKTGTVRNPNPYIKFLLTLYKLRNRIRECIKKR